MLLLLLFFSLGEKSLVSEPANNCQDASDLKKLRPARVRSRRSYLAFSILHFFFLCRSPARPIQQSAVNDEQEGTETNLIRPLFCNPTPLRLA